MKRILFSTFISPIIISLLAAPQIFAEANTTIKVSNTNNSTSDINVQNSTGESTVCINGNCTTTTGSDSNSTNVCINGTCYTSDTGNLDVQSDNGNNQVHIHTSPQPAISVSQNQSSSVTTNVNVTVSQDPSSSPTPVISKKAKEEKKKDGAHQLHQPQSALQHFITSITHFFQYIL